MIDTRNRFIDSIDRVLKRQQIEEGLAFDIAKTQLFVPRDLFQIPAVAKAMEQDGRRDCLWRLSGCMFHDNEVSATLGVDSYENNIDILCRTTLHIADDVGTDKQHFPDLTLLSTFKWVSCEALGLSAFDVAAIHGNTHLFHAAVAVAAAANVLDIVISFMSFGSSCSKRTCMHWAACFGHLELVEDFIKLYRHPTTIWRTFWSSAMSGPILHCILLREMDTRISSKSYCPTPIGPR
jgi:hypothetical protein